MAVFNNNIIFIFPLVYIIHYTRQYNTMDIFSLYKIKVEQKDGLYKCRGNKLPSELSTGTKKINRKNRENDIYTEII